MRSERRNRFSLDRNTGPPNLLPIEKRLEETSREVEHLRGMIANQQREKEKGTARNNPIRSAFLPEL